MYFDQLSNLGIKLRRRSGTEKTTCPQCSESRRNKKDPCLSVNITEGVYNCHNCGWKGSVKVFERQQPLKQYTKPNKDYLQNLSLTEKMVEYAKGRGISESTLQKFMVHAREEWMPQTQKKERCIAFPYIRGGDLVNVKFRDGNKNFKMVKDAELIFFGMQTLENRHAAIIVEGEWDALAAYEAGFGQDYPPTPNEDGEVVEHELGRYSVLSVPNGASKGSQRLEYLDNCSDWLASIDEFVIAVDGDEAGIALKDELVRRLGAEKCRIVEYPKNTLISLSDGSKRPPKDLNEVLVHLGVDALKSLVMRSQAIPVDGIYYLEDVFESMIQNFKKGVQLAPTTRFGEFDDFFRWKKGEINLFTGYANAGKTLFVLQLMLTKSFCDGWKWAIFSPENYPANDFFDDLVEMYLGKWLSKCTEKEYVEACSFINEHIFYVYPEHDHDLESIHQKFRHLILKKGVDGVLIDPFNQLDKTQKAYERDDQYLSVVLKDIKRFALLNGVSYNIIAHPKNPTYKDGKELPVVDMYDLHGGSMWGNKADNIVVYHRPKFHQDPNDPLVDVYVRKVKRKRTGGKHGFYSMLFDWATKRFSTLLGVPFLQTRPHKFTTPEIEGITPTDFFGDANPMDEFDGF